MNIKVSLTHSEAISLLQPAIAAKHDDGNGIPPVVSVEIMDFAPLKTMVPPPTVQNLHNMRTYSTMRDGYRNKIGLIKEVRSMFGWGLKEAKDFVEAFYGL